MKLNAAILTLFFGIGVISSGNLRAVDFPLRVDSSNRFLSDQSGTPFLIRAAASWSMIIALNQSEVTDYLDDRRARGFNTVMVELILHDPTANGYANQRLRHKAPINRNGDAPFTTPGDFSTPNETYFAHADWVIDQAASRGMLVVLFPCYVGYPNTPEGWYNEILANQKIKCQNYGAYVGNRYKNKANIIWAMYGDHNPDENLEPLVAAMVAGIKSADTTHLFTAHLQRNNDTRALLNDPSWINLVCAYTDTRTYFGNGGTLTAYAKSPTKPVFLAENHYEGSDHQGSGPPSPTMIRAQAYWANLSGACGQAFGNTPLWFFDRNWEKLLDSVGARDITLANALILSRPWTKLVPDTGHTALTAGYGTSGDVNFVAAARASDGSTLIAYLPKGGLVTVDLTKISGSEAKGCWFNPRTGATLLIDSFPTTGSMKFQTPTEEDWVLVIDDKAQPFHPPGSLAPTITRLTNQSIATGAIGPLHFTLRAAQTAARDLIVTGRSSNSELIPDTNITFGGNGAERTITIAPIAGQTGSATITITVTDGPSIATSDFSVTVTPFADKEPMAAGKTVR